MKRYWVGLLTALLSSTGYAKIAPISEWQCNMMKSQGVLNEGAPLGCDRLSKVDFDFTNFDGQTQQGSMIVFDVVAPSVERIFTELHKRQFPLHSARLMREFRGDDTASMAANNSSAFNARSITGGSSWSKHAYGVAIDINPVQNPFLEFGSDGKITVKPIQSVDNYINRTRFRARNEIERQGMAEDVTELFAYHGFLIWGGDWNTPIDTQHFEVGSRQFIEKLVNQPKHDAMEAFNQYVASYRRCFEQNEYEGSDKARAMCAYKTVQAF